MSNNILHRLALVTVTLALSFSAAGCGKKSDVPVDPSTGRAEVFIWRMTEYKDLFRPYAGTFMENNKKVQLWYSQEDPEGYEARSINAIATGEKPQVWSIPVDWLPCHKDKLVPMPVGILGEKVTDNVAFMKERIIPGADEDVWESFIVDNQVWGLPFTVDTLVLYYNPRLFREAWNRWQQAHPRRVGEQPTAEEQRVRALLEGPPKTWEDLVEVAPLLTIRSGDKIIQSAIALGTADNVERVNEIVQLMIYQNGGDVVSKAGKDFRASFNQIRTKENGEKYFPAQAALELFKSFSDPSKANYSWNKDMPNSVEAFINGQVAMIIDFPTLRERLVKDYPGKFPDFSAVPIASMLQISQSQEPVNLGYYQLEVVTKAARVPDKVAISWAWILSYMKTESSQAITEILKRPSPHKSITEARAREPFGIISKQALTARVTYKKNHAQFDQAFKKMIRDITQNGQPVVDGIFQGNDAIDKILVKPCL